MFNMSEIIFLTVTSDFLEQFNQSTVGDEDIRRVWWRRGAGQASAKNVLQCGTYISTTSSYIIYAPKPKHKTEMNPSSSIKYEMSSSYPS